MLRKKLAGRRVLSVLSVGGRYKDKQPDGLSGFLEACDKLPEPVLLDSIACKGKFQHWSFAHGWKMWCTYGMSGQWSDQRTDHAAVILVHGDPQRWAVDSGLPAVFFNDPRHFGTLKFVYDPDGKKTAKKLATLGPSVLAVPAASPEEFAERMLKKPSKTLAEALMDQSLVSGVGNYLKAECLYLSGLSPHRLVGDVPADKFVLLWKSARDCAWASYNTGGATISTYRNVDGTKGGAQSRFAVYGNRVDPLGHVVVQDKTLDGRTTWWVPEVQS